jgi:hypothetical protein
LIRRCILATIFSTLLASGAAAADAPKILSDKELVAIAAQFNLPIDKWPNTPHGVVGLHHGTRVTLDTRCSDICPDYTTTVIHYDVQTGRQCRQAHGVDTVVFMPISIASMPVHYCVPRVLLLKNLIRFQPYMK